MTTMKAVGEGHELFPHAHIQEENGEYVVELDVADFTERELRVEVTGLLVKVCGDQLDTGDDSGAFRLHERLEESFRLPDDADANDARVFYRHGTLAIRVPRLRLEARLVPIEPAE